MAGINNYRSPDFSLESMMAVEGSSDSGVLLYSPEGQYLGEGSNIGKG